LYSLIPESFFIHPRIQATSEFVELLRFASMTPLTWAPTLTGGFMSSTWKGVITVHEIIGRGLISMDSNGTSDPFIVAYLGDQKKYKAPKIMKTLDPHWEDLDWKIECNAMDTITFEIWDWDLVGGDDYMGEVKFSIISLLSTLPKTDNVFLTKTHYVASKNPDKLKVSGILTITLEFSADTNEQIKINKHFGKPLIESIETAKNEGLTHLTEDILMLLMETGITSEGIIRIPGSKPLVLAMKEKLDAGFEVTEGDPYDLAGLLKLYLAELPDSLIPESIYLKVSEMNFESPETAPILANILRTEMPEQNWNLLESCCKFFCELCRNTEITKMLPLNIGISIGPTVCLSQKLRNDTMAFMAGTKFSAALLSCIITNATTIFNWQ